MRGILVPVALIAKCKYRQGRSPRRAVLSDPPAVLPARAAVMLGGKDLFEVPGILFPSSRSDTLQDKVSVRPESAALRP